MGSVFQEPRLIGAVSSGEFFPPMRTAPHCLYIYIYIYIFMFQWDRESLKEEDDERRLREIERHR